MTLPAAACFSKEKGTWQDNKRLAYLHEKMHVSTLQCQVCCFTPAIAVQVPKDARRKPPLTFMGGLVPLTTICASASCHSPTAMRMGRVCGGAHTWRALMSSPLAPTLPIVAAICTKNTCML
jgi:hypothetical protein